MTRDRFARVKELFLAACEQSVAARKAFLNDQCGEDKVLRDDVQRLLDAHDQTHGLFTAVVGANNTIELPGEIAGFAIIGVLGAGGMGVVYRARQQHPAREVALKVLRGGLFSAGMKRRFVLEAEVLGRLHHPAIAQVYQAGEWQDDGKGQPYFAMELVEGRPFDVHGRTLDTRSKLNMMADICDAVEHAHQKGVIHRDLKPGNILVTASGEPKILDFGIARATDSDIRVTTQRTDVGQLIGTVAYMSPEQAAGDPKAIDHRSDIYSLGVILYELLAGDLPLDLLHKSLPDAVRAIRDDDPAPLSTFNRTFRGDLDTIVAKSMEKDRDRRYQTAAELAADIRHYLSEEPIAARPASTLYQLGKFSRRHKGLVAGVGLAMVMLCVGTVASTMLALRAEHRSRELALSLRRLEASNKFLTDTLEAANPEINRLDLAKPRDVRVVDVLDYAAANLAAAYGDQPQVEISIRATLGETYLKVEQREPGREQIQAAFDLAMKHLGEDHPETIRLGIKNAELMATQAEAEAALRPLYERSERVNGRNHSDTIACLNSLVGSLYFQQRHAEALPLAEDAAARSRRMLVRGHDERLTTLNNLAFVMLGLERSNEAEALLREVLNDAVAAHGENHPAAIRGHRNLVSALRKLGRTQEAIAEMRRVVEAQVAIYGQDSPTVLFSSNNLAILLGESGDLIGAAEMLEQIVEGYKRRGESETPDALLARHNLAGNLFRRGQLEQAEQMADEVLQIRIRVAGDDSLEAGFSMHLLAQIHAARDKHGEAIPLFQKAVETLRRIRGDDHAQTNLFCLNYAQCLMAVERFEEAELQLLARYRSCLRKNGADDPKTAQCMRDLADLNNQWGRPDEARVWVAGLEHGQHQNDPSE